MTTWRLRPSLDTLDRDGDRLILLSDTVVRVSGISPSLLDACQDNPDTETVVARMREIFGDPPSGDARELVVSALVELTSQGLVEPSNDDT